MKYRQTGAAHQLSAKNMLCIEPLNEEALPTNIDETSSVNQGEKCMQIGSDAFTKHHQALLTDADVQKRGGICWIDTTPSVGHSAMAFMDLKAA